MIKSQYISSNDDAVIQLGKKDAKLHKLIQIVGVSLS